MGVNLTGRRPWLFVFYRFLAFFKVYLNTTVRKTGPCFHQLPSIKVLNVRYSLLCLNDVFKWPLQIPKIWNSMVEMSTGVGKKKIK